MVIIVSFAFFACKPEKGMIRDAQKVNKWIYETARDNYLWADEFPPVGSTDLLLSPGVYFDNELRYRHDPSGSYSNDTHGDRFSAVTYTGTMLDLRTASSTTADAYGLGFDTCLVTNAEGTAVRYAQVLYITPGSPADAAGLRRGDCFNAVNGTAMPMALSDYHARMLEQTVELSVFYPVKKEVKAIRGFYADWPVIFDTVYLSAEPPTAYLVYNHFARGESDRYISQLREIFSGYARTGVRDLILDLRYNTGGEMSAATALASMIVGSGELGKPFVYLENSRNYGQSDRFEAEYFHNAQAVGGSNADISNLCVITPSVTASASEMVIHGLRGCYADRMTVVGERTRDKNVGGSTITNRRYEWELYLITSRIYDRNRISGYETGLVPDISDNEISYILWPEEDMQSIMHIGQFGDIPGERLLNRAWYALTGSFFPSGEANAREGGTGMQHGDERLIHTCPQRNFVLESFVID